MENDEGKLLAKNGFSQNRPRLSGRYEALAETSADAIIVSDANDKILAWNSAAERIFGHGQEIVGQPVTVIVPPDYRRRHREGMRHFLASGEKHILGRTVELQALRADGTMIPIELSLSTWQEGGHTYFGAIIRDISERKQYQQLRENLNQLMRHDLKSPLIGVTGYASLLLKESGMSEKQQKLAQGIFDLGKRALELIERFRDLHHLEFGSGELKTRPVDLAALLEKISHEMSVIFEQQQVTLDLRLRERAVVNGDEALLSTMLENLLKNAAEASPAGARVRVTLEAGKGDGQKMAELAIHNQGEVPPEVRDRFFEPFVTSGKASGTGLGTYSARLVAEAHGGNIRISTGPELGTEVIVRLPMQGGGE